MIKNIVAVGDSFTYGEELKKVENAYPYLLANKLSANIVNLAKPGSGNKRMIRSVMDHIVTDQPVDLVIIGWSSPGRMEFADADGVYDIWPGRSGNVFESNNQLWRNDLLNYINKHHDPAWIYKQYLLDVILMQNYLKSKMISYLMVTTVSNEYYHSTFHEKNLPLSKEIDRDFYLGWPTDGMAEWTSGCKRGPNGHFLEDGHKKVAEKLYEHIRYINWIS